MEHQALLLCVLFRLVGCCVVLCCVVLCCVSVGLVGWLLCCVFIYSDYYFLFLLGSLAVPVSLLVGCEYEPGYMERGQKKTSRPRQRICQAGASVFCFCGGLVSFC